MTLTELKELLEETDLPVGYHHFRDEPEMPYIVYLFDGSENFGADGKVYRKVNNYRVELYSNKKDLKAESIVEETFDNAFLYYEKYEDYIKEENMYMVVYELQI